MLVERRVLAVVTGFLVVGLLLWIIAISTNYWGIVDGGKGIYVEKAKRYFLESHTGVWRTCRTSFQNTTKPAVMRSKFPVMRSKSRPPLPSPYPSPLHVACQ